MLSPVHLPSKYEMCVLTAKIRSLQSIAAILSPSEPPEKLETSSPKASLEGFRPIDSRIERSIDSDFYIAQTAAQLPRSPSGGGTEGQGRADEDPDRAIPRQRYMIQPTKLMRSSIACSRCRKSKIRCINNGTDTVCVACQQNNRECTYPLPAIGMSSTAKRSEHPSGVRTDGEGESKRARKREADSGARTVYRSGEDPLETPPISLKLWRDIYSLFILHYSTELPFLHEATFFDRIKKMQESGTRSRQTQIFLLGMLSLTARFVSELVAYPYPQDPNHHSRLRSGEPLNASEFYAHALEARLDAVTMATPSLDTIQALLMLGLYNWGMCRGMRSWMWVGNATRMAYAMGLSEEEPDVLGKHHPVSSEEAARLGVKRKVPEPGRTPDYQAHVLREIKRRTMWGCFILDRYLSSGRARPQMSTEQLQIQLPCSEEDFRFGTNVKTEFLYSGGDSSQPQGTTSDRAVRQITTSPVSGIYIRLVEIWGRFSKWSCAGGRRTEKHPPWDDRSEFHELRKRLDDFRESLPPRLTFSSANLAAHVGGTAMTVYTAIHTLYSLCEIVLHREYIPFVPLRCNSPIGPLDEPTFPKEVYVIPEGFWEESAEPIFRAAKNIMEIVQANSERGFLIECPQVGFAIWTAAFVGVYSIHFPHMDTVGYMNRKESHIDILHPVETVKGATGLAVRTLNQMSPRMKMAYGWSKTIKRMHEYFDGIIKDYHQNTLSPGYSQDNLSFRSPADPRKLSLREGGRGGGLEEYKLLEKELKEFVNIEEDERHCTPTSDRTVSRASTSGPGMTPHIKAEANYGSERTHSARPSPANWPAVNTSKAAGGDGYGRPVSYSLYGHPPAASSSTAPESSYYPHPSQSSSKAATSNSPDLVSPQAVNLSPPFNTSDLVNMQQQQQQAEHGYHTGTLQHVPQFSGPVHRVPQNHEQQSWLQAQESPHPNNIQAAFYKEQPRVVLGGAQVAGFSDGLPFDMWAGDGHASFSETDFMQVVWHQAGSPPQPPQTGLQAFYA